MNIVNKLNYLTEEITVMVNRGHYCLACVLCAIVSTGLVFLCIANWIWHIVIGIDNAIRFIIFRIHRRKGTRQNKLNKL